MTAFDYLLLFVGGFNLGLNVLSVIATPRHKIRLAQITNPEALRKWQARQTLRFYVFLLCAGIVAYRVWG